MDERLTALRTIRGNLAEIRDGLNRWPTPGSLDTRLRELADNASALADVVEHLARVLGARDEPDATSLE